MDKIHTVPYIGSEALSEHSVHFIDNHMSHLCSQTRRIHEWGKSKEVGRFDDTLDDKKGLQDNRLYDMDAKETYCIIYKRELHVGIDR